MNYSKDSTKKKEKEYKSKKKKAKSKIGIILFRIFFISLLTVIFAGVGATMGLVVGIIKSTPPIDVNQITPEGYATILFDDEGNEIAQLSGAEANRIWVDIEDIPNTLEHAFIAIEDERFYQHNGIDIQAILRAFVVNLKTRSIEEGGSTITQQLIKYNVLTFEQTLIRKIQEQYLALVLEKELTDKYGKKGAKDIILENYLNTINLANGAYGVQSAAEIYFGKDVSQLTFAESAVIAATANSPTLFNPLRHPDVNAERAQRILDKMFEQGYMTLEDYEQSNIQEVYTHIQNIDLENKQESSFNSYFVDAVIEDILKDLIDLGYSESQANNLIYRGGLSIYTTQDSQAQDIAQKALLNEELFPEGDFAIQLDYRLSVQHSNGEVEHFSNPVFMDSDKNWGTSMFKTLEEANAYIEAFKTERISSSDEIIAETINLIPQPQASMVIMDYQTGHVKALVGGRGEKKANRTLNRATDTTRSPGSTFKVLAAYAPAIDTAGYTPATIIDDAPFTIKEAYPKPYTPNNWYATKNNPYWYKGLSTVREGIIHSMNILAVKTVYDIGIPTAFDYLLNFGFSTLREEDKGYSLPLGGLYDGVTNLELTAAYGSIANKGVYVEPILYTKVVDQNGNVLLENVPDTKTVIKETTAFLLTDMMEDVVNAGTGTRADFKNIAMPIAGKTGTSQDDKDLLFVGYTPYYVAGVWTGFDQPMPIKTSKSYHLELWRTVMEEIHLIEELPYKEFERPSGITTKYICTESGKLATDLCENDPRGSTARLEYFVVGTEPTEECDVHVEATICTESDLFATEYCPSDTTQTKIFIKRPENMRLNYEEIDEKTLEKIADYQYELPASMEGEYCNIHGPNSKHEEERDFFIPEINIPIPFGDTEEIIPPVEPNNDELSSKDKDKGKNKERDFDIIDDFFEIER